MSGSSKKPWFIGGALLVAGAFGFLIYGGIGDNLVYFLTPEELGAKGAAAYDVPVKLGGQVVPGSVKWDAQSVDLRFQLTGGTKAIAVHAQKAPPQMFKEGQGVIVEGKLNRSGVFESSNLMVKHSNEYRAPSADHAKRPNELYKSLITDNQNK
jgi:cytochrome c-type biogenesis protein CcmE